MKITVITVTFNSGLTLRDTMESVWRQKYPDIEYIVVDGASTDNTVAIIKEYERRFRGCLKWISEKDAGLYDAMNKGIRMATGDVVGILNSDDYYTDPDVVAKVANAFLAAKELDLVYGDVHFVKPNALKKCVRYYSSRIFARSYMRIGLMPAHPSCYIKRACFVDYGLYKTDYTICADFELLLRFIYIHRINICYLPVDMVTMRTGGVSTTGWKSHLLIMKEHLRAFRENRVTTNVFLLSLRYFYKLTELFLIRKKRMMRNRYCWNFPLERE